MDLALFSQMSNLNAFSMFNFLRAASDDSRVSLI